MISGVAIAAERTCRRCGASHPLYAEHFYPLNDGRFHWYCRPCHRAVSSASRRRAALRPGLDGRVHVAAVLRVVAYGRLPVEEIQRLCARALREVQADARRA